MKNVLRRALGTVVPVRRVTERDRELLHTVRTELLPHAFKSREDFVPAREIGHAGIAMHADRQLEWLSSLETAEMFDLFSVLRKHPDINVGHEGRDYAPAGLIHNQYYPTPDAEVYASMIATHRPKRILEVGSGYSTVIARTTVGHLNHACEIVVIDPEPRRNIEGFADHIEYARVETSSLRGAEVAPGSFLFIDSSHVCRSEGDLPFLYCQVLPTLPPGVIVHVHDIFTPFDYPDNYYERFYTEQYLLQALLATSAKFDVLFATHFQSRTNAEAMRRAFGGDVGRDPLFFGASFWFKSV